MNKPSMSKGLKSDFVLNIRDIGALLRVCDQCEYDDDHLSDEQRAEVVKRFKEAFPQRAESLPEKVGDAYLKILEEYA